MRDTVQAVGMTVKSKSFGCLVGLVTVAIILMAVRVAVNFTAIEKRMLIIHNTQTRY